MNFFGFVSTNKKTIEEIRFGHSCYKLNLEILITKF